MSVLNVRLPASLHEELKEVAGEEQISMNQMVLLAVAEKLATRRAKRELAAREPRLHQSLHETKTHNGMSREEGKNWLEQFWQRRADESPLPGDELPSGWKAR